MKVEREKEQFKPVIITLESESEVSMFYGLIKVLYYSREILDLVDRNFFFNHFVFKFMDALLPMLERQLKSSEKTS